MATLISPGVSTTIVDESFFIPGRATALPLIFIATGEEKVQEDGTTPALGTYEHNVYREVTSIRQSIELYGIPNFIRDDDGNAHHGDSRNEYGLDALNKFLEIGNRAYVVRANVNLDDRLESIRELWRHKIEDAAEYLEELVEEYIAEYNAVNGYYSGGPNYKEDVDNAELKDILGDALVEVFEVYSFSDKNRTGNVNKFADAFLSDHTVGNTHAMQEIIFNTDSGFLTRSDTTSLETGVEYGFEVVTDPTTTPIEFKILGENAKTFGQLIDEINGDPVLGTEVNVDFVAGRLRFSTVAAQASARINITDGSPLSDEKLFENLTLYSGISEAVDGAAVNPLPLYPDGYDNPPGNDAYNGLYKEIDDNAPFKPDEARNLLLVQATIFEDTMEFRDYTKLGDTDDERRDEILVGLRAAINNPNLGLRNPDAFNYNLVACPGYPETATELLRLAEDMLDEVFVVGSTPIDKRPIGYESVAEWATSSGKRDNPGIAYWYPHGISSNIDGHEILTESTATALRTIAFNDRERDLWWAPAGTQRGQCTHLSRIGYVSGTLGMPTAFIENDIDLGTRDSLYEDPKNINPITRISGRGILILGQRTTSPITSARQSINVERLLRFIKREIRRGVFPYLFEPHDRITWDNAKATVDNFLLGLIDGRALYDFATICDETNNTPDRIDRQELWIDVAVKPVRAVEFIYVPIRVVNTGADIGTGGSVEATI